MENFLTTALGTFVGFCAILLILLAEHEHQQHKKRVAHAEAHKAVEGAAKSFIDQMFEDMQEERHAHELLEAISRDVIGKRKPKASDGAKIEKAFHENMEDHWAQLTFDKKSGKFDVVIQKEPFAIVTKPKAARKQAVKKAPAKKPVAKKEGK